MVRFYVLFDGVSGKQHLTCEDLSSRWSRGKAVRGSVSHPLTTYIYMFMLMGRTMRDAWVTCPCIKFVLHWSTWISCLTNYPLLFKWASDRMHTLALRPHPWNAPVPCVCVRARVSLSVCVCVCVCVCYSDHNRACCFLMKISVNNYLKIEVFFPPHFCCDFFANILRVILIGHNE